MSGQAIRNRRATEIRRFTDILDRKSDIVRDVTPLRRAEELCRKSNDGYWEYSIDKLIFHLGNKQGKLKTIPQQVHDLKIQLTMDIKGHCEETGNQDPFEKYEFQLLISGMHGSASKVESSWHLDRHVELDNQRSRFVHPQYHFQFGGRALNSLKEDQDSHRVLIIDSPRIPHPPLDALLGIDFILTNFIPFAKLDFREERDYVKLIENMQARLWKPYANSLAAHWQSNAHGTLWQAQTIWPQLV